MTKAKGAGGVSEREGSTREEPSVLGSGLTHTAM